MEYSREFERMTLVFKRANGLPQLPGSAIQLVRVIDSGDASAKDLERIIAADPSLAAAFLRMASSDSLLDRDHATSIRATIMKLGQRSVRSLAISLSIQQLLHEPPGHCHFDHKQFARHSIAVGFLSRYLFARQSMLKPFESLWSAEEMFAAGLLHDLGHGLLAKSMPDEFNRVYGYASRAHIDLDEAFEKIYGAPIFELWAHAANSWGIPTIFIDVARHFNSPWMYPNEYTALCCVSYANYLAETNGFSMATWPIEKPVSPEVTSEIVVPEEEIPTAISLVSGYIDTYLTEMMLEPRDPAGIRRAG